ncbi:alpha-ketoglutarate-dependent dioxygenase AlkB family protein [Pedobacter sp. AW1-32]|uniref:alpha-ketoglutarate-dependent dioxygenase AlkB family protein n=1 Tax=Pedobacter sp. AW1-32 TaxID=3383026 RepID=UPI003FEF63DA
MEQLSFFKEAGYTPGLPIEVLEYRPEFISDTHSDLIFNKLIQQTPWVQKVVKMYDKDVLTPRLSAWYGDPQAIDYTVLGKSIPLHWTDDLYKLKNLVEPIAGITFNSVLLNYYRDGQDSVAWHSDNETVMGSHPTIASLTFGQVRCFDIRKKNNHKEKYSIRLEHGSLLIMKGDLQQNWEHRIAKSSKAMKARINLTFRKIINLHQ